MQVDVVDVIPRIEPISGKHSWLFDESNPWPIVEQYSFGTQVATPVENDSLESERARLVHQRVAERLNHSIDGAASRANAVNHRAESKMDSVMDSHVGLSQYLQDFHSLEARDPRHDDVELALDPDGRIHVLLRNQGDSIEQSLLTLHAVRRWALEHLSVLAFTQNAAEALAHPSAGFEPDGPIRLHLLKEFTTTDGQIHLIHEPLI
jgi:hypothetical protein